SVKTYEIDDVSDVQGRAAVADDMLVEGDMQTANMDDVQTANVDVATSGRNIHQNGMKSIVLTVEFTDFGRS
ncbi:MAG: hypothetical protein ACREUQ_02025, partial [Burkholderiales bacterium]